MSEGYCVKCGDICFAEDTPDELSNICAECNLDGLRNKLKALVEEMEKEASEEGVDKWAKTLTEYWKGKVEALLEGG